MAKKAKNIEKMDYSNRKIEILHYDVEQAVKIDGKMLDFGRDADTGAYVCSEAPYRSFGTLDELAKSVIDEREAQ